MNSSTIVWRGIYLNGHEYCRVHADNNRWQLTGVAVFSRDNTPSHLQYVINCDLEWRTISSKVTGRVGEQELDLTINVEPGHSWWLNGVEQPQVQGSIDIDLNFSPSTNLVPIRRSRLATGEHQKVKAAWLRFPSFTLEPLEQTYTRLNETTYRYESAGGKFVADLTVNEFGLVTNYPGIWEEEVDLGVR